MSSVKKQKTIFTPRPGLSIKLNPIADTEKNTPVSNIASVSSKNNVNNNKEELITNIEKWQGEIENQNSENINNYIESSFSFFQGTKIGDRNDEDKVLAEKIKNTIAIIEEKKMLDTDNLEPKILSKYNAIKRGFTTNTFGGSKVKKSYKKTSKKITKRKKSVKNRK